MKKLRLVAAVFVAGAILAFGVMNVSAQNDYKSPAEAAAGVTERTIESVMAERKETGKTYGTIAHEAGKLAEFQEAMLRLQEQRLADKVEKGYITAQESEQVMETIRQNQAICNGTGTCECEYCVGLRGNISANNAGNAAGAGWHNGNCNGNNVCYNGAYHHNGNGNWNQQENPAVPDAWQNGDGQENGQGQGWNQGNGNGQHGGGHHGGHHGR